MRVWHDVSHTDERLIHALNELIAFDLDAMAAYAAAIEWTDDPEERLRLADLEQGHRRQIDELTGCVSMMGGQPRVMGDMKLLLTQGRVMLATVRGERGMFEALRANEKATVKRYDAVARAWGERAPARVGKALVRGLDEARARHRWLVRRLGRRR